MKVAPSFKDIGKRMRGIPMLWDLDVRFRVMDAFDGYEQVLSLFGDWSATDEQGLVPQGWDSSRAAPFIAFFLVVTLLARLRSSAKPLTSGTT